MKIQWLGHSCFRLTESTGTTILTDPYDKTVGEFMPKVTADAVTLSHHHGDHDCLDNVEGKPLIIDERGGYEVDGVDILSMLTYHDDKEGALRGENLVFKYRLDGVDVCHLGDIGETCSPMLLEAIGSVDVLLVPVGGKDTITAEEAKDFVEKIMPSIVVPMHYKTSDCNYDIAPVDDFTDLFDEENITYLEGDSIELDRTDFDGDFETKVLVFKR